MADQKPTPSARVHLDDWRRGEGLQALVTLIQGAPQPQAPLSYYTPILNQCTLPHSDPKVNPWICKNGDFSLTVSSGFDRDGTHYGIPYGLCPRLVVAYIITQDHQLVEKWLRNHGKVPSLGGETRGFGFDHGAGHPLLFLDDAKVPNCRKNNGFMGLGNYSEWPKVAGAVIKAEDFT